MEIPNDLKLAVTELLTFFDDPKRDEADQYEVIETHIDALKFLTQRFERGAQEASANLRSMQEWFRERTDPAFAAGWLLSRCRKWPEGYPGDYITLEAFYANQPRGAGLSNHLDRYALSRTLGVAVRSRLRKLAELLSAAAREEKDPAPLWLNVACGPCRELLALTGTSPERTIHCVDTDQRAIEFAKALLAASRGPTTTFSAENAFMFMDAERNLKRFGRPFSLIYSAGLFDYLPDNRLAKLIRGLYGSLTPNGLLIAPFKDADRYETFDYHWIGKWDAFLQRRDDDVRALLADAGIQMGAIDVERDESGVVTFFILRR